MTAPAPAASAGCPRPAADAGLTRSRLQSAPKDESGQDRLGCRVPKSRYDLRFGILRHAARRRALVRPTPASSATMPTAGSSDVDPVAASPPLAAVSAELRECLAVRCTPRAGAA